MPADLLAFLTGGLMVAVTVLAIHDQQNIAALKRQHARLKKLEASSDLADAMRHQYLGDRAWQEGERKASADIAAGRVTRYASDEEFLQSFEDYRSGSDSQ